MSDLSVYAQQAGYNSTVHDELSTLLFTFINNELSYTSEKEEKLAVTDITLSAVDSISYSFHASIQVLAGLLKISTAVLEAYINNPGSASFPINCVIDHIAYLIKFGDLITAEFVQQFESLKTQMEME